jgi:hypothetical protein
MTSGEQKVIVPIVIGCDTDPDRESLLGPLPAGQLQWRGMLEGIPALKQSVAAIADAAGSAPRFTWLLRADEQVRAHHGSFAWALEGNRPLLDGLAASGDELGWHPHFWRFDASLNRWYQEIDDGAWQLAMLRDANAALRRADLAPTSVRMGWTYHTSDTMRTLEELGVRVDFSALPGLRTLRESRASKNNTRSENLYDWFDAPATTYRPSRDDHRRAERGTGTAGSILELPTFVARSAFWGLLAGAQLARKTRGLAPVADAVRRPRYIANLTSAPALFAPLIRAVARATRRAVAGAGDAPAFATYFHPDELLVNRSRMYALEHVRSNLSALLEAIRAEGGHGEFLTATGFAERVGDRSFVTA